MVRSPCFVRALSVGIGAVSLSLSLAFAAAAAPTTPAPLPAFAAVHVPTTSPTGPVPMTAAEEPEPLQVTLSTISPSTVPRTGPIRVTGTVINIDDETWSTINLYPFISATPMTTEAELAEAVTVPVGQEVGARMATRGPFAVIDALDPGESYSFAFDVPRDDYTMAGSGVYWFGVHALGEGPVPRDLVADGRARTFLPYVPGNAKGSLKTALIIPLRRYLAYEDDGQLANLDDWTRTLGEGGRMRGLVDFGAAAGSNPVTWLIDPALPEAVRRIAVGNPARSLEPTQPIEPDEPESPDSPNDPNDPNASTDAPSATLTPSPTEDLVGDDIEVDPGAQAAADVASQWLVDLQEAVADDQVLTLPYGDVDVAAAAEHSIKTYQSAAERSGAVVESWGLPTTPGLGSPSGFMDAAGIEIADPSSTILVTDRMFGENPPAVAASGEHQLVITSAAAASGGPGPGVRLSAIGLRQRILSQAALRLLDDGAKPLVVMLPVQWNPTDVNVFFDGLQPEWLELSKISDITDRPAATVDPYRLDYPKRQAERELDESTFTAANELVASGEKLQNLLTRNDQVARVITDQALSSTSYAVREAPRSALEAVNQSRAWIDSRLRSVQIDAPPGVTLSGGSGSFGVTLTNRLDQPVTVQVSARGDKGVVVTDTDDIQLAADSRTTILMDARTRRLGVHNVTLLVTDLDGQPLGSVDVLPVRSTQVSTVIWLIMATGAGILFVAIGVRLVRRFRRRHDPEPGPEPEPEPEPDPPSGPVDE